VIAVAGSRHDAVAEELVRRWPGAALCGAEDLTTHGWRWPTSSSIGERKWVIDGATVPDHEVTGVFVRRSTVYPDEFPRTHPDDRTYLAAESHAFLVFVLATTGATVVNPVRDATFGADALRPEEWMAVASRLGVVVAPLRITSGGWPRPFDSTTIVEVVGREPLAEQPVKLADAAVAVTGALGLTWAVAAFDDKDRLGALSITRPPSTDAACRLGQLLLRRAS
jgi:hypothetical protein